MKSFHFALQLTYVLLVISMPSTILADSVPTESYGPVKYEYSWNVYDNPTANNYGQTESRDGGNTVRKVWHYHAIAKENIYQIFYFCVGWFLLCTITRWSHTKSVLYSGRLWR